MQNCGFGWENRVLDAAIAVSGEVPGLPGTNLRNQHGAASLGWRVPSTGGTLTLTLSGSAPVRAISLHRTNLSAAATWHIELRAGGNRTYSWDGSAAVAGGQCVHVLPAGLSADTITLWVNDPNNPDGFLSIPLAFVGPLWQPARNYSTDSTETLTVGQQSTTTLSGGEFVDARYVQRGLSIAHQSYGDADAAVLRQIQRAAATGQNILFIPDPDSDPPALAETALFGRLSGGDLSNPFGPADRHAQTLTLTERL
ncbi:hypothetical protein M2305_002247 [Gluconobacter cerinus]|uniref:hypothetical protein n=1 Tax=Gluconobacter cerinus TaxID=38307 RepID=UPI002227FDB4|nr:hypothetical protein [Gluconobacter cerinus]MCW2266300.1 hypothetical protein [Gluconobacter cerinus]